MPILSAFTPCGAWTLSSKPSHAERIYRSIKASLGGNFADTGYTDAKVYAIARALSRAQYTIERAANQVLPLLAIELLPLFEGEYGLVPGPTDTVVDRQRALAAKVLLPSGFFLTVITHALQLLLGSDFEAYLPGPNPIATPIDLVDGPGVFLGAGKAPRSVVLTGRIYPGTRTVDLANLDHHAASVVLKPGDTLIVDPGQNGLAEAILVIAATVRHLTATFINVHEPGTVASCQDWPYWTSTQRRDVVVLSAAAALDPVKRRKVDNLMGEITRGVSTWGIATRSSGGFLLSDTTYGRLGANPL